MMPSDPAEFVFGDLVLVPFPFTDQSTSKRRPAAIVSTAAYNSRHPDVILMPITSQLRGDARPGDVVIEEWRSAGLLKPSAVKPVVATMEQSLIIRRLGALAERDREAVATALRAILG